MLVRFAGSGLAGFGAIAVPVDAAIRATASCKLEINNWHIGV
jgi:hypothetical protein